MFAAHDSYTFVAKLTETPRVGIDTWIPKKDLDFSVGELSAVAVDDKGYYMFGGHLESGANNKGLYYYEIATDSWTELMNPTPDYAWGDHQTQQVYNGKIYSFGGSEGTAHAMRMYDPDSNSWSELAALTVNGLNWDTLSPSSALIGDKMYVAGGIVSGATVDNTFEYDITNNAWTEKAAMPSGRNHAAGIGYNDKFYLFGGRQGDNVPDNGFDDSFVYDASTDSWSSVGTMQSGTGGNGQAVEVNGKLLVMGGEDIDSTLGFVHCYDPSTDTWEYLIDMITPRHGIAPVAIGNSVYVVGGGVDEGFSSSETHEVMLFL